MLLRCHPERSEGSGLTLSSETAQRALARVPDPPDAWTKFFAYGELLLATAPKVTKRAAPESAPSHREKKKRDERVPCASRPRRISPTGHSWPVGEIFGILPRPASTRGPVRRGLRCSAQPDGENVHSTATAKAKATSKACDSLLLVPSPLGGEGQGEGWLRSEQLELLDAGLRRYDAEVSAGF